MRLGLTTGTCFIAAVKAALIALLTGCVVDGVVVETPVGLRVEVPISEIELRENLARVCVVKDADDNTPYDVTHGVNICVEVTVQEGRGELILTPGEGVGQVKDSGEIAISHTVREYLRKNIREVLGNLLDYMNVELPTGNPYVSPILDHINLVLDTLSQRVDTICFVLGGLSMKFADKILQGKVPVLDVGDHVGYAIVRAVERGFRNLLVFGHAGKIVKLSGGVYMLCHYYADARLEILTARLLQFFAERRRIDQDVFKLLYEALTCPTVDEALRKLDVDTRREFPSVAL